MPVASSRGKTVPGHRLDWKTLSERIDLGILATELLGPAPGRRGSQGSRLWWRCPFHEDQNPSFTVGRNRRFWKCFGCGAHGDAATLVMRLQHRTFPEAIRLLDQRFGTGTGVVRCANSGRIREFAQTHNAQRLEASAGSAERARRNPPYWYSRL